VILGHFGGNGCYFYWLLLYETINSL